MQESLCEKWFLQHFMDTDAMLPVIDAMDREIWKELPQPTRGSLLWLRGLQAALQATPSLAWSCTQYAISDGGGAAKGRALLFWVLAAVIIWERHDPTGLW